MSSRGNPFDSRQEMQAMDFEVFHSINNTPVLVDYHSHDFCEVLFFISGNVSYMVEGKTYRLRHGDIILTNNKELHKPIVDDGCPYERYVVWVRESFFNEISGITQDGIDVSACFDSSEKKHYNLLCPCNELFKTVINVLDSLMTVQKDNSYGYGTLRKCYMGELLVYLNRAYLDTTAGIGFDILYNEKISDIIYYINQNLCEPLMLETLAKQFFISKYYLTRLFKKYTGLSLHHYITKKRLIHAKMLLQQGHSASEACSNSGFNDYSHFSRSFVEEYSVSPRAFIEMNSDG